ncbi:hypothetical protein [Streptomyces sp. NPDC058297]|uniref:hypothetical protein n=1 Tax=unclassified Streptomyces TaxID=2593676 RepID=UPI0036EAEB90
MTPELLTGIVGAVGAVFGAGGVVVGQVVTARSQRQLVKDQADANRLQRQTDAQREACVGFLSALAEFEGRTWLVVDELLRDSPDLAQCTAAYEPYLVSWRGVLNAQAAAETVGSEAIATKAQAASEAVHAVSNIVDDVYARLRTRDSTYGRGSRAQEYRDKLRLMRTARDEFATTVRHVLNGSATATSPAPVALPAQHPSPASA